MWSTFAPSGIEDKTINNAFCANGLFKICATEPVSCSFLWVWVEVTALRTFSELSKSSNFGSYHVLILRLDDRSTKGGV